MATSGSKIGPKPKGFFGTYSSKMQGSEDFERNRWTFTDSSLLKSKDFDGLGYQITRSHGGKSKIPAVMFLEYVWRARGFNGNLWVEDRPDA